VKTSNSTLWDMYIPFTSHFCVNVEKDFFPEEGHLFVFIFHQGHNLFRPKKVKVVRMENKTQGEGMLHCLCDIGRILKSLRLDSMGHVWDGTGENKKCPQNFD
jgi:hypothetical protein